MSRTLLSPRASLAPAALLATAIGALLPLTLLPATPSSAAPSARAASNSTPQKAPTIVRRDVSFLVDNTTTGSGLPCSTDGRAYRVRGTLIGTNDQVNGYDGGTLTNVLVHDAGTGAWFWDLPEQRRYDYAGGLARAGQLVLVLDRLGYDASRLSDGRATCMGAQVSMLHQVIQKLYGGDYRYVSAKDGPNPPAAQRIVVHGHGTGAAIAATEAGRYQDVNGVVLMSWARTASSTAQRELDRQQQQCGSRDFASFGATRAAFARLLFASAPSAVRDAAERRRNGVPCGDVGTQQLLDGTSGSATQRVTAPVLLLNGTRDARQAAGSIDAQTRAFPRSRGVSHRTFAGAGSALPLEAQAPQVRSTVVRWLRSR